MTATPTRRAPRTRRQLLRSALALALLTPGAMATGHRVRARRRTRAERPKFRLVTRRFARIGTGAFGGASVLVALAQAAAIPKGRVSAIALKLSLVDAVNGGYLNATLGSGPPGAAPTANPALFRWGLLISDAGNGGNADGVTVTISSRAKKAPSRTGQLRSGTYKPTNYDGGDLDSGVGPLVSIKSFLGKPAQQDWWAVLTNDGPSGGLVSVAGFAFTITVKVRR